MKIKKMLGAGMIAVCLMTGCANPMVAIYDNDIKIASNTNSYNLNNYEQTASIPAASIFLIFIMYLHKLRFIQLRYYHNHAYISITFSLNFFLPPLNLALLPVMLSTLVLKLSALYCCLLPAEE